MTKLIQICMLVLVVHACRYYLSCELFSRVEKDFAFEEIYYL